jgi:hypothetical protein
MNKKTNKLQKILERITSAGEISEDELGPDARSLREAWLELGRFVEAAQPCRDESSLFSLREMQQSDPLSRRERVRVRAVASPRWTRLRRWFYSAVAISAAAVLIGVLTSVPNPKISTTGEPTAAIKTAQPTFISSESEKSSIADDDPLQDSLDERISQIQWRMYCARQDDSATTSSLRHGIEQMQNELAEGSL